MQRSRFSEDQIIAVLKEHDAALERPLLGKAPKSGSAQLASGEHGYQNT